MQINPNAFEAIELYNRDIISKAELRTALGLIASESLGASALIAIPTDNRTAGVHYPYGTQGVDPRLVDLPTAASSELLADIAGAKKVLDDHAKYPNHGRSMSAQEHTLIATAPGAGKEVRGCSICAAHFAQEKK